jgi:hypothetical protein
MFVIVSIVNIQEAVLKMEEHKNIVRIIVAALKKLRYIFQKK